MKINALLMVFVFWMETVTHAWLFSAQEEPLKIKVNAKLHATEPVRLPLLNTAWIAGNANWTVTRHVPRTDIIPVRLIILIRYWRS